jgi:hypothetical protein
METVLEFINTQMPKNAYTYCALFTRVARWFLFKPKIPIWVNFGGS